MACKSGQLKRTTLNAGRHPCVRRWFFLIARQAIVSVGAGYGGNLSPRHLWNSCAGAFAAYFIAKAFEAFEVFP
ncbi:MAG: hypothetical protein LJU34_03170, partial [Oscillospiraceae bacterium]|nr:hypothetical protein [Oscillospiraceae bacterium]